MESVLLGTGFSGFDPINTSLFKTSNSTTRFGRRMVGARSRKVERCIYVSTEINGSATFVLKGSLIDR